MNNEQGKIIKAMRTAIKNGNLDAVKELLDNNDGLLEVNTVFGFDDSHEEECAGIVMEMRKKFNNVENFWSEILEQFENGFMV